MKMSKKNIYISVYWKMHFFSKQIMGYFTSAMSKLDITTIKSVTQRTLIIFAKIRPGRNIDTGMKVF